MTFMITILAILAGINCLVLGYVIRGKVDEFRKPPEVISVKTVEDPPASTKPDTPGIFNKVYIPPSKLEKEMIEKQRLKVLADIEAFQTQMSYNADMAYKNDKSGGEG